MLDIIVLQLMSLCYLGFEMPIVRDIRSPTIETAVSIKNIFETRYNLIRIVHTCSIFSGHKLNYLDR